MEAKVNGWKAIKMNHFSISGAVYWPKYESSSKFWPCYRCGPLGWSLGNYIYIVFVKLSIKYPDITLNRYKGDMVMLDLLFAWIIQIIMVLWISIMIGLLAWSNFWGDCGCNYISRAISCQGVQRERLIQ